MKNIALFYARTGDNEQAVQAIERAIELTPNDPDTHFFAGLTYLQLGDTSRYLRELERAVEYGYPVKLIDSEHALDPVRETERFRVLLADTAN